MKGPPFDEIFRLAVFPGRAFVTASECARRPGWSKGLVTRLLGEPDARAPNPYYPNHAPLRLYCTERIRELEASEAFAAETERVARQKAAGLKARETRLAALRAEIDGLGVRIKVMPRELLVEAACRHYNARRWDRWERRGVYGEVEGEPASADADPAFLERISVNFLRHQCSPFDRECRRIKRAVGRMSDINAELVDALRRRVHDAIAEAYPWLAGEARRQVAR